MKRWLEGHREVNRITDEEFKRSTMEDRWRHREIVQAMLSLMPKKPSENVEQPRRLWTLLKDKWLERGA